MQRWNGEVWNVNETCAKLGEKCLQLLSLHYLTGSDTTSFLFGKGKIRALKILKNGLLPNLDTVHGEADIAQEELKTIGESFFCIMYGYPSGTKIGDVRYQMYTKKKAKLSSYKHCHQQNRTCSSTLCVPITRFCSRSQLQKGSTRYRYFGVRLEAEGWYPNASKVRPSTSS